MKELHMLELLLELINSSSVVVDGKLVLDSEKMIININNRIADCELAEADDYDDSFP